MSAVHVIEGAHEASNVTSVQGVNLAQGLGVKIRFL